ncbi:MAG: gamma-glutamylcyclotransferase [Desulfuromonadales bacterium]|nr:gamma-glutamylcyclotransferase [Desulfuromonadales bacterium]
MQGILLTLVAARPAAVAPLPIFVYGTLRPGEKNYPIYLQGRTIRESVATARGELYYLRDGGYPYLQEGEGVVRGELVEITPAAYEETLRAVDGLEEYNPADEAGSVYLRRRTRVKLEDGGEVEAWTYYWNRPSQGERILSGDFKHPNTPK